MEKYKILCSGSLDSEEIGFIEEDFAKKNKQRAVKLWHNIIGRNK